MFSPNLLSDASLLTADCVWQGQLKRFPAKLKRELWDKGHKIDRPSRSIYMGRGFAKVNWRNIILCCVHTLFAFCFQFKQFHLCISVLWICKPYLYVYCIHYWIFLMWRGVVTKAAQFFWMPLNIIISAHKCFLIKVSCLEMPLISKQHVVENGDVLFSGQN